MLQNAIKQMEASGLPVTYREWPEGEAPELPWVCWLTEDTNPLFADGGVYYSFDNVVVELYTKVKDPETEAKVEAVLSGFHWKKNEDYLDTERCYLITYEIEV